MSYAAILQQPANSMNEAALDPNRITLFSAIFSSW